MSPLRRRSADPQISAAREAFRRVTTELDAAQRVLLGAIATSRDAGSPLDEALDGFLAGVSRAEQAMPSWRIERTEALWRRCAEAIVEARSEAQRLRDDPATSTLAFEPLNARLADVVSPLEEFADVASEIKRLR